MDRQTIIKIIKPAANSRYAYSAGRIRALENHLARPARLARYFEARNTEDISRLLLEDGYPAAPDPEASLELETTSAFELVRSLAPDPALVDILILSRDFHNLKVMLKAFSVYWPRRDNISPVKAALEIENMYESGGRPKTDDETEPDQLRGQKALWPAIHGPVTFEHLAHLLQKPSLVDPRKLFDALYGQNAGGIPPELADAASAAARKYQQTYDISEIDNSLDKSLARIMGDSARAMNIPFFTDYLSLKTDLMNVGMLLRTRFLHSGADYLKRALLPGGKLPPAGLAARYDDSDEDIAAFLSGTRLAPAAEAAAAFSGGGDAISKFSLAQDDLVVTYVRKSQRVLRGPEILIGYLVAREMDIRTIRIILTCLRNGIPSDKARELARLTYL
jgi:V/A-type H+/Na+-transporting ATPase subunit C